MKSYDFAEAFGNPDQNSEMIREYWRDVRANWDAHEKSMRRRIFLILALAAVFVLIGSKSVEEVNLLGVKLANLDFARALLPAVMAYLAYSLSSTLVLILRLSRLHGDLAAHFWPEFYSQNLELAVAPVGSASEAEQYTIGRDRTLLARLVKGAINLRWFLFMGGPTLLVAYTLWWNMSHPGRFRWFEYTTTGVSILLLLGTIPSIIFLLAEASGDD